ncbi:hypothetical protein LSAT2_007444 [Lamellibrachia satsuma]|nr:hypothetical protein LSAT2_007444 [Lamellibrachia satsuma]
MACERRESRVFQLFCTRRRRQCISNRSSWRNDRTRPLLSPPHITRPVKALTSRVALRANHIRRRSDSDAGNGREYQCRELAHRPRNRLLRRAQRYG